MEMKTVHFVRSVGMSIKNWSVCLVITPISEEHDTAAIIAVERGALRAYLDGGPAFDLAGGPAFKRFWTYGWPLLRVFSKGRRIFFVIPSGVNEGLMKIQSANSS
jgi:hypothetical protein